MGRQPKPPHLKAIEGGRDRKDRRKVAPADPPEPVNPLGEPSANANLSARQLEIWHHVGRELPPGLLKSVDRYVLIAFCRAVALQDQASEKLSEGALLMKTTTGNLYQSPYIGIINTQAKQIKSLGAELGLSPAARTRISMGDGDGEEDDPAAKYFA